MIYDHIERVSHYRELLPALAKVELVLSSFDPACAAVGRFDIEPEKLYYMVQTYTTRAESAVQFEAHRRFIDLQYLVRGKERIYCAHARALKAVSEFDAVKDVGFFSGAATSEVEIGNGMFALLFPDDAHKPTCVVDSPEEVMKIVFKIALP